MPSQPGFQGASEGLPVDTRALDCLVGYNARRVALYLINGFMHSAAEHGLRPVEFSVLSVVRHNPGITSSQVSQALELLPPNLVRLVQGLEARGLLRRQRAPTDRRAIGLYATDRGARLLKNAQSAALSSEQHMLEHLSADEKDALIGLLRRVYT
jgi:DNA-binding MarR family transcriptional regulator